MIDEISDDEVAELYAAVKRHEQSPLLGVDVRKMVGRLCALRDASIEFASLKESAMVDLNQIQAINSLRQGDNAIPALCRSIVRTLDVLDDWREIIIKAVREIGTELEKGGKK